MNRLCCASQDGGNKLLSKLFSDANITSEISSCRTEAISSVEDIWDPRARELCSTAVNSARYFDVSSDAD